MEPRCVRCDGPLVAAVQHGSYLLRCPACGANSNCTSWCAVGPTITHRVAVYREGAEESGPVLVGVPAEMWQRVRELAPDGSFFHLRAADTEPGAAPGRGRK
jgi:hypothetical protein